MTSKGKKDKGNAASSVVEEPPEREVIPGKITESQWLELLSREESSVVAGEVVEGLVGLAFAVWQDQYLEKQSFPNTIETAKTTLLQIIEWEFLQRDEGERDPGNDPSWLEDDEPVCSVIDSWARGIVPLSSDITDDDVISPPITSSRPQIEDNSPQLDREVTAATSVPPQDSSRQPTRASTIGSSSTYTTSSRPPMINNTAIKVQRPKRPKARRPQARLVALTQPQTDQNTTSQPDSDMAMQAPSPALSHTPTSSPLPTSHPPPLPYNMKPAQLCWQKDVTYDSSGKIVDMLRLDPSHFPSHRVNPRVHLTDPSPCHGRKHLRSFPTHNSSPLSLPHTSTMGKPVKSDDRRWEGVNREGVRREGVRREGVGREGVGREGDSLTRQGDNQSRRGATDGTGETVTRRFPDVLTLPSLVDTIDPSPGVCIREGNRSVYGPRSPRRPPHFLLPHTTMLPVRSPSDTSVVTGGDAG